MELVFALLFLAVGLSTRPVLGGDAPPRCFAEPLCLGAATGNVELVTRELKEGTWSSAQDRLKVNMLYGSGSDVFYGSGSDAMGSLTALGTEAVDFTGRNGFTALMVGAGHGHRAWAAGEVPDPQAKRQTEVVGLLIRANAAVDVQDDFGYTALMNAAEVGDTKIVKLLLAAKARTDLKTNVKAPGGAGRTALDLANAKQATARTEDRVRWTSLAHVLVKAAAKGRMEEL